MDRLECANHSEIEIKQSTHESMGTVAMEDACHWAVAGQGRWMGLDAASGMQAWTEKQGRETISKLCVSLCECGMSTEVQFMDNAEEDDRAIYGTIKMNPSEEPKRVVVKRMRFEKGDLSQPCSCCNEGLLDEKGEIMYV